MESFFFDMDADMRVGRRLARRGHVLTSAAEQHLGRATDREILLLAARQNLILVTHNEADFAELHFVGAVTQHAGIIALPQVSIDAVSELDAQVDRLVASGLPMANELYRYRLSAGWERAEDILWIPLELPQS